MAECNDHSNEITKLFEKIREAKLSLDILLDPFASDPCMMMAARNDPMAFMFQLTPDAATYLAIQIAAPAGVLVKLSADLVIARLSAAAAAYVPRTTDLGAGHVGLVTKNTYRRRLVVSFCLDPCELSSESGVIESSNAALENYRLRTHATIVEIYKHCKMDTNATFTMYQPRIGMEEIAIKIAAQANQNNPQANSAAIMQLSRQFLQSAMFEYLPRINRLRVTHTNIEIFGQIMIDDIVFLMLGEYLYINLADFGIVRSSEFKTDWALRPISGMYEQVAKNLAPRHCVSCGLHEHNVDLQGDLRCADCVRYVDY